MTSADQPSEDNPTPLMAVRTEQEAAVICGALRSSGIRCAYLRRQDIAGGRTLLGDLSVRPRRELRYAVMVGAGDREAAREIVRQAADDFQPDLYEAEWLPD